MDGIVEYVELLNFDRYRGYAVGPFDQKAIAHVQTGVNRLLESVYVNMSTYGDVVDPYVNDEIGTPNQVAVAISTD